MSADEPHFDLDTTVLDADNPEWTDEDFAQAKPLSAFPELEAALKRGRGRPAGSASSDRQQVTLRLPRGVVAHFRQGGPGWQTRAIAVLEKAVKDATL